MLIDELFLSSRHFPKALFQLEVVGPLLNQCRAQDHGYLIVGIFEVLHDTVFEGLLALGDWQTELR